MSKLKTVMYPDKKRNRILLPNGISLMEPEHYAQALYEKGETLPYSVRIPECAESETFEVLSGIKVGYDVEDPISIPWPLMPIHSTNEWIDYVMGEKYNTADTMSEFRANRCIELADKHGMNVFTDRITYEVDYFARSPRPDIISEMIILLSRFIADGVVWGVGRGSSCASLVFYILGVHDIDPIEYDIPFSELTKEQTDDY